MIPLEQIQGLIAMGIIVGTYFIYDELGRIRESIERLGGLK